MRPMPWSQGHPAALGSEPPARMPYTLNRLTRAWQRARDLTGRSRELRRAAQAIRERSLLGPQSTQHVVWTSPDERIRCHVIPHRPDEHQVTVTVDGEVIFSQSFADPVEAAEDSQRLRRVFLG
jgi:hypothetical protein